MGFFRWFFHELERDHQLRQMQWVNEQMRQAWALMAEADRQNRIAGEHLAHAERILRGEVAPSVRDDDLGLAPCIICGRTRSTCTLCSGPKEL